MKHLLPLVLALAIPVPAQVRGSIEGIVIDAGTSAPLRNAWVGIGGPYAATQMTPLERPADGAPFATTETGPDGHFRFSNLAPGNYEVRARKPGYGPSGFDQLTRVIDLVSVAAGQERKDVTRKLERNAVLTGIVRDAKGQPMQDAVVQVMRRVYEGSRYSHLVTCPGVAYTNDLGEYRIPDVPAGRYLLRIWPLRATPGVPQIYSPWFDVAWGKTIQSDFTLGKGTVARLSGEAIPPDGVRLGQLTIGLSPYDDGPVDVLLAGHDDSTGRGPFQVSNVPPGRYWLTVADREQKLLAVQDVKVEGDTGGLFVRLAPARRLRGTVFAEQDGSPRLKGMHVKLLPLDVRCCFAMPAAVQDDATFSFAPSASQHYALDFDNLPPGYFVRSVRLNGKEAGAVLSLDGDASLTIALGKGGASLDGSVSGAGASAYSAITLIPVDPSALGARNAITDGQGKFHLEAIAPGKYKVLAWETPEDARYLQVRNADVLAPFASRTSLVTLEAGARQNVSLTLIPAVESRKLVEAK